MSTSEIASPKGKGYTKNTSLLQRAKRQIADNLIWYLFVSPAVALILVFMVAPIFQSLSLALYRWNGILPREYIHLENFKDLWEDRFFIWALQHTFIFSGVAT